MSIADLGFAKGDYNIEAAVFNLVQRLIPQAQLQLLLVHCAVTVAVEHRQKLGALATRHVDVQSSKHLTPYPQQASSQTNFFKFLGRLILRVSGNIPGSSTILIQIRYGQS